MNLLQLLEKCPNLDEAMQVKLFFVGRKNALREDWRLVCEAVVTRDREAQMELLEQSANLGNSWGMALLGQKLFPTPHYSNTFSTKEDKAVAMKWFRKSGNGMALFYLGEICYYSTEAQNAETAFQFHLRAAEKGFPCYYRVAKYLFRQRREMHLCSKYLGRIFTVQPHLVRSWVKRVKRETEQNALQKYYLGELMFCDIGSNVQYFSSSEVTTLKEASQFYVRVFNLKRESLMNITRYLTRCGIPKDVRKMIGRYVFKYAVFEI
jgi:TPR repeat protein